MWTAAEATRICFVKSCFWSLCFSERRKDGEEITRRQAQEFVPSLQGLEDLGNLNPGLRSVLAHGHCSLCPGLLSVGRSALQFGTRIARPSKSVCGPLPAEAEKGAAFQPGFDVPTVSPPPPCRPSTRKWACRECGRYCGPRELSGAVRGQPQP